MRVLKPLLIGVTIILAGSLSQADKVKYYNEHPQEEQNAARDCVEKMRNGGNIEHDSTCNAVIESKKEFCKFKQSEGALIYSGLDCNDNKEMLGLAYRGD